MPFVIFRARSRERPQRQFRADFRVGIASRCVYQWKLNLELQSSTIATTVVVAKITGERGWSVKKKVSLHRFSADQKIASSWQEKMRFGASYSTSNKLFLPSCSNHVPCWQFASALDIIIEPHFLCAFLACDIEYHTLFSRRSCLSIKQNMAVWGICV